MMQYPEDTGTMLLIKLMKVDTNTDLNPLQSNLNTTTALCWSTIYVIATAIMNWYFFITCIK
jgi:hypothetical protein